MKFTTRTRSYGNQCERSDEDDDGCVFRECRDEGREGRIRVDRERRRRRAGRDVGGGFASAHVDVAVEPERQDVVRGLDLGGHDAPAGLPAPRRAA
jgi:hypothetical protein